MGTNLITSGAPTTGAPHKKKQSMTEKTRKLIESLPKHKLQPILIVIKLMTENAKLKAENAKLKAENAKLKDKMLANF